MIKEAERRHRARPSSPQGSLRSSAPDDTVFGSNIFKGYTVELVGEVQ